MVKRKCDPLDLLVGSVDEGSNSEVICLVDGTRSLYGVDHWPGDDVWINDSQVKRRRALLHELPCGRLRACLRDIVAENGIISLDCLLSCNLD